METVCICGRVISKGEEHTGECQYGHWLSCNGISEDQGVELRRIMSIVASESKESPTKSPNSDSTTLKITVGKFTIHQLGYGDNPEKIAIYCSGEGGDFSPVEFEKVIGEFYSDNF